MEGWVGLVGWPRADSLPTKWSPDNRGSGGGQRNSAGQRPTSYPLSHAVKQLTNEPCAFWAWCRRRRESAGSRGTCWADPSTSTAHPPTRTPRTCREWQTGRTMARSLRQSTATPCWGVPTTEDLRQARPASAASGSPWNHRHFISTASEIHYHFASSAMNSSRWSWLWRASELRRTKALRRRRLDKLEGQPQTSAVKNQNALVAASANLHLLCTWIMVVAKSRKWICLVGKTAFLSLSLFFYWHLCCWCCTMFHLDVHISILHCDIQHTSN